MADSAELMEERRFTYADYKQWELAEGERYELIDGVPYMMSAPNDVHQAILIALAAKFYNFLEGKPCKVRPAPYDVRLFYQEDEQDDTVVQPDLAVICDEKKRGKEGCRGAPDLVAEILSPSNTAIEMTRKFELYRKAGVREYWIVNPESKGLIIHRFHRNAITTHSYGSADTVPVDLLPGLAISLEPVFAE
ncbi:MAG: Uma2 family endonuclease [Treponema sp.]|jgi:Uma2 family endonuclease|nr:Uma2 family endonuclease [Treponema sp.]